LASIVPFTKVGDKAIAGVDSWSEEGDFTSVIAVFIGVLRLSAIIMGNFSPEGMTDLSSGSMVDLSSEGMGDLSSTHKVDLLSLLIV